MNAIAKEVAASRPEYAGVRIDTLAYEETLLPPTKTAPAANVTIRVCPIDADFHVPFTDERNANPAQAFKVCILNFDLLVGFVCALLGITFKVLRMYAGMVGVVRSNWRAIVGLHLQHGLLTLLAALPRRDSRL